MPSHLALLRGINVGGHGRLPMPQLREIAESLGHTEVATYIQSGNLVFTPADPSAVPAALAMRLEDAIEATAGLRPPVVVLTCDLLARAVEANPFPDEADPKRLHAVFFATAPGPGSASFVRDAEEAATAKGSRDRARYVDDVLYLHTPDGLGRSELAARLSRAKGPLTTTGAGTARNWATVTKLLGLCRG